ncbi:unnamed protein product, partial [Coregonus sp. 'balchen']
MLRKGSELFLATGSDREVLLDLDYVTGDRGEPQTTDRYGSLQNGGFIPPRCVMAASDEEDNDEPIYVCCDRTSSQLAQPLGGNYFRDGRTKIVWEVKRRKRGRWETSSQGVVGGGPEEGSSRSERRKAQLARWRDKFTQNLQIAGLLLEKDETASVKTSIHYLKLSAPWDVLVYYAEELIQRAPLQVSASATLYGSAKYSSIEYGNTNTMVPNQTRTSTRLTGSCIPNVMAQSMPNRPLDYYTCAFRKSKMEKFIGFEDHDTYFTNTQRHHIVYELLARTVYGKRKRAEMGYQPLDHIREYFGEKIAFYFAWLGFYTAWLLPASVVGTFVFVSRDMSIGTKTPAHLPGVLETQDGHPGSPLGLHGLPGGGVTGVKEPYFPEKARLSRMLTGSMVIIIMLCVVMIFLVTVIMYRGIVSVMMYRTGSVVLRTQAGNIANISSSLVNLALILLMGQVYTALALQLTKWEMQRTQTQYEDAFTFKVFVFQFVNFYSSPFYVAFFKGSMMLLVSGWFDTPAIDQPFVSIPMAGLWDILDTMCGPGGCFIELAEQLFIIMVGKQLISNVKAWQQKRALNKVRGMQASQEPQRWEEDYQLVECEGLFEEYLEIVLQFGFITIFVAAFPLAPLFALLNNWAEMRLDAHKFVCEYRRPVAERAQNIGVWFNILEALSHLSVIINAFLIAFTSDFLPRLLYQYKFDNNLNGYVNFTLAYAPPSYTSHPMCRYKAFRDNNGNYTLVYWELLAVRLGFIIAFEHVVFFVLRAIDWMVPDVPESLELKMKRERYLAKQALADNQEALFVSQRAPASSPETKRKREREREERERERVHFPNCSREREDERDCERGEGEQKPKEGSAWEKKIKIQQRIQDPVPQFPCLDEWSKKLRRKTE